MRRLLWQVVAAVALMLGCTVGDVTEVPTAIPDAALDAVAEGAAGMGGTGAGGGVDAGGAAGGAGAAGAAGTAGTGGAGGASGSSGAGGNAGAAGAGGGAGATGYQLRQGGLYSLPLRSAESGGYRVRDESLSVGQRVCNGQYCVTGGLTP